MSNYKTQISRIKSKLGQAKKTDNKLEVFGADSHKYKLNPVINPKELDEFESLHKVRLPEDFRLFLMELGNGGAGPYYGIYPLKKQYAPSKTGLDCVYHPEMTDEEWNELYELDDLEIDGQLSEWDEKTCRGNLSLGTQGCTYDMSLVVAGENKGRVYYEIEDEKPFFVFESNFLDWYERWLDEIIAGYDTTWFGYRMGGDENSLIKAYNLSQFNENKIEALKGVSRFKTISNETIDFLINIINTEDNEVGREALLLLTQFSYEKSISLLSKKLSSNSEKDILCATQSIHWYAKKHVNDWVDKLRIALKNVNEDEVFTFIGYVFANSSYDYGKDIIPFISHESAKIRSTAAYILGQLQNKSDYIEQFKELLQDNDTHVLLNTIQALDEVNTSELIPYYENILNNFKSNDNYLHTNIRHRAKDMDMKIVCKNSDYKIIPKLAKSFIKRLIGLK